MKRACIIVLDSFGIGASHDAAKFGDEGTNTLGNIALACASGRANKGRQGLLKLPNLNRLGLGKAAFLSSGHYPEGLDKDVIPSGAYGYASEISSGKDTPSGHWEITGVPVLFDWYYFTKEEKTFPKELLDKIVVRSGIAGYLGNKHASGTVIIEELGMEHIVSGKPIFYTSADSVFQIAAHEKFFGLSKLYQLCDIVREELNLGGYNVGRVIARPFIGDAPGEFKRTGNRRDLTLAPPSVTVLEKLVKEKQGQVVAIGKIADIYANVGITKKIKITGIDSTFDSTLDELKQSSDNTIIFSNFVDFDSVYGHRRDVSGYAAALEHFDQRLPDILQQVTGDGILILTADHGCDPTARGSDHTREHIPILIYGPKVVAGELGHSETFADIGQTLADYFGLSPMDYGKILPLWSS